MYGNTVKRVLLGADIHKNLPMRSASPIISLYGTAVNGKYSAIDFSKEMLTQGTLLLGETGSGKTYCLKKWLGNFEKVFLQSILWL